MALPSKTDVQTLKYASADGVACFVTGKSGVTTSGLNYVTTSGVFFGIGTTSASYNQDLSANCSSVAAIAQAFLFGISLSALSGIAASIITLFVPYVPASITNTFTAISASVVTFQRQINKILIAEE